MYFINPKIPLTCTFGLGFQHVHWCYCEDKGQAVCSFYMGNHRQYTLAVRFRVLLGASSSPSQNGPHLQCLFIFNFYSVQNARQHYLCKYCLFGGGLPVMKPVWVKCLCYELKDD